MFYHLANLQLSQVRDLPSLGSSFMSQFEKPVCSKTSVLYMLDAITWVYLDASRMRFPQCSLSLSEWSPDDSHPRYIDGLLSFFTPGGPNTSDPNWSKLSIHLGWCFSDVYNGISMPSLDLESRCPPTSKVTEIDRYPMIHQWQCTTCRIWY